MKRRIILIAMVVMSVGLAATVRADQGVVTAASALVKRVLGDRATEFVVESIPSANGKNVFEVESRDGKIVLRGDNAVSVASARPISPGSG